MLGPGKYDDECTAIRTKHGANCVMVIVLGGERGHGFSVQARMGSKVPLVSVLRELADEIERDTGRVT